MEIAEPVARLTAVTTRLAQLKDAHEAETGAALVALAASEPFPAVASPVRMLARLPQRSVVTVTTNVPGPRVPLYLLGRELREIVPYVPIASNLRIGVAIFSYRDRIAFGVTGDYDSSADVEVLARGIESGLRDLAALARAASDGPARKQRKTPGTRARKT